MANFNNSCIPGQTYLIYVTGKTCSDSFFDEAGYNYYLVRLLNSVNNFHVKLHAYSLLSKEIYLLLTPGIPNGLPRLLRSLNRSYSDYFNQRFERKSDVWSPHFSSSLIQGDPLILDCQKFVERIAMQSKRLSHPGIHHWSSYSANSFGGKSAFLVPHRALVTFLKNKSEPYKQYREFIAQPFSDAYEMYLLSRLKFGKKPARKDLPIATPMAHKQCLYSNDSLPMESAFAKNLISKPSQTPVEGGMNLADY